MAAGRRQVRTIGWREGDRGPLSSQFIALRVRPANDAQRDKDGVLPEWWLVAEWPADKDEPVTYWRSNLPDQTPIVTLVRLAKLRWRVEHDDRELKNASGSITTRAAPSAGCTTTSPASPSPTPF